MSEVRPAAPRFPVWPYVAAFFAILVFGLWPLASVAISTTIADLNNCTLNEANTHPCMVLGADIGGGLYTAFVLGWFMLATIPLGALGLVAWLVVLIVHIVLYRRRRARVRP